MALQLDEEAPSATQVHGLGIAQEAVNHASRVLCYISASRRRFCPHSVLDLLLLSGLRRLDHIQDRLSRALQASSSVLPIDITIWRSSATSSSQRFEAARLAEAGLEVVDLGLAGGGAGVDAGGYKDENPSQVHQFPQSFHYQAIGMRHILVLMSKQLMFRMK